MTHHKFFTEERHRINQKNEHSSKKMILFVVAAGVKQALPGADFQAPGERQQELTSQYRG
ncbi:hypothetical protein [Pseudomonas fluorescens]|uniref:hypothetical protein n=1 Tax=Pseudomonas fluorescens TaxID=294 RepID=UPI0012DA2708|nr:hypothetical protein [Pseudomonas fluorescens]